MRARLIYAVDDKVVELESTGIDVLDQYTCRSFKDSKEMFNFPRYKEKLAGLSDDGMFFISVLQEDLPEKSLRYLCLFGRNPFEEEQLFDVMYYNEEDFDKVMHSKTAIAKMLSDRDVFEEFFNVTEELYTPSEKFAHQCGIIFENGKVAAEGVIRVLHDALDGRGHYDICRVFIDGISRFDSMQKKNGTYEGTGSVK